MTEPWHIPQSWAWVESYEIAEIVGGGTPRTDDPTNFDGGDIPWITPADLSGYKEKHISRGARNITSKGLDNSGARLMPEGTVLFSSRAPIGYVAIASNPLSTNQGFKSFVLHPIIKPDYAYYYLQRAKDLAVELSSGTTFREISGAKAALIPFPVAPIAEQKRIVGEIEQQFTRLDVAVAALKRVKANLKRYRAAVLKAACEGRLVPTEAELARREGRSYEPAPVLLERILAERRSRWEATEITTFTKPGRNTTPSNWKRRYKIPEQVDGSDPMSAPQGWAHATLDQLTSKIVDGTHFTPTYVPNGVPFLSVKDVHDDSISFEDCKFIPREEHELLSKRCNPEKGDLLVTKSGTIGRSAVIEVDTEFSLFVSVALLKPATNEVSMRWLALVIQNWIRTIDIQQQVKGSALKNLHLEDFRIIRVAIPPKAEQMRIIAEVDRRWSLIRYLEELLETNLRRSEKLRQTILKRAFEGKLVPQNQNDEPATTLLERIRGTANPGCAPAFRARRNK